MWGTKMECRHKWSWGAVVEEFMREGEVVDSNPGWRKVCKNREKYCNHRVGVCVCRWGPLRIKKNLLFLPLFGDLWKLIWAAPSSHGLIGTAVKIDATNHLELPLQNVYVVVMITLCGFRYIGWFNNILDFSLSISNPTTNLVISLCAAVSK